MKDNEKKQEYLEIFDKVFGTNTQKYIDLSQVPLIIGLHNAIREGLDDYNKKFRKLRRKRNRLLDELQEDWTEEQKQLFNEYCEVTSQMDGEIEEQIFVFSIILAKEFDRECEVVKNQA